MVLVPYTMNKPAKVYSTGDTFVKLWPVEYLNPHQILDGLSTAWCGLNSLASYDVGLITTETCPCFNDLVFDGDVCCGYILHTGQPIRNQPIKTFQFLRQLAQHSINIGYAYTDITSSNIVDYRGQISLIDIGISPIRLNAQKTLTHQERPLWLNLALRGSVGFNRSIDPLNQMYWNMIFASTERAHL